MFKVGDRVTYGSGTEVLHVTQTWTEEFRARPGVQQQVVRLAGEPNDVTMRADHLRPYKRED